MERGQVRFIALGGLILVNLSLVYSQLAFFPIFSGNVESYFHSMLFFVPFAAIALYLDLPLYMGAALVLGALLCVHANVMPIDYYEVMLAKPVAAIGYSCVGAFVIWGALRSAHRASEQGVRLGSPWARRGLLALAILVASCVLTFFTSPFLTLMDAGPVAFEGMTALDVLLTNVSYVPLWYQVLLDALAMALCTLLVDTLFQRLLANQVSRTLGAVFRRWLLAVVVAAFLVTNTIGFCIETIQSTMASDSLLENHVSYLTEQVQEHVARQDALKKGENDLVLSKAWAAARLIQLDPDVLASQADIEDLRDALELASLTVCDGDGLVVADSDGRGIGTYNFFEHEPTNVYAPIASGSQRYLIEEPRNSVDESGTTKDVRVFAGVARDDADGLVQVSISAQQYQVALAAASLDHLADNYTFGKHGEVFISHEGVIVTSNKPEYVGMTLVDMFVMGDYPEDIQQAILNDLYSGETSTLQDDETMGRVYMRARSFGDYGIFVSTNDADVFDSRTDTIIMNTIFYLVLFAAVFALASVLLNNVVVRGFARTNSVLALITGGDLEQRIDEHETKEFDTLSDGINATVGALKDSIAEAESRYDRELATAKAIQESALPSTFPPFPEVEAFDIYASMNAAREVGGDFYDFFLIDDHTLGFLIADVSGKGIPASLFMMAAKTQIENYMSTGMPLAEAVQTANHHLCQGNDAGMFVTVWAATLDWETGELTYVNAGHNPPLLRHDGTWEWLKKKCGLFLGTFETAKYRQETLMLEPGDELYLYTDGVNEAFSASEEEFGNERLEELLSQHTSDHPRALIDAVRGAVAKWSEGAEQSDDITMLSLEYGVAPEVRASLTVSATLDQLERVMGFVHAELGRRLCPIGTQNKLDIALEEMFVNVCNYAYADREEPGTVTVSYVYSPNPTSMTIELDDTGIPFDPLTRRDPTMPERVEDIPIGGLGIMMTKRCVDDIAYVRDGEHNRLAFNKRW